MEGLLLTGYPGLSCPSSSLLQSTFFTEPVAVVNAMNEQVSEVGSLVWARMKGVDLNSIFVCSLVSQVFLPGLPGSLSPS